MAAQRPTLTTGLRPLLWILLLAVFVGCSAETASDSAVLTPPSPTSDERQGALGAPAIETGELTSLNAPTSSLPVTDIGAQHMIILPRVFGATSYEVARADMPTQVLDADEVAFMWPRFGPDIIITDYSKVRLRSEVLFVHAMAGDQLLHTYTAFVGCPDWAFISARGSGQNFPQMEKYAGGLGSRGRSTWRKAQDLSGLTTYEFPAIAVDYEAVGVKIEPGDIPSVYNGSVDLGVTETQIAILETLNDCANTRLVLFGFSQGAQVIGDAYAALSPAAAERVALVVLLADPKYTPGDPAVDFYPTALDGHGVKGRRDMFFASPATVIQSWCWGPDAVCQGSAGYKFHGDEYDNYEDQIATFIADLITQA